MRIHRRFENIEFAKEARGHRQPEQRKQVDAQHRRDKRLALRKSCVIVKRQILFARATQLRNDGERAQLH